MIRIPFDVNGNKMFVDNVTYYDKVLLRMSFIGYQAPNVGHIL